MIAANRGALQVGLIRRIPGHPIPTCKWRILRQAFSCPDRHLLVWMVGDPKQAISASAAENWAPTRPCATPTGGCRHAPELSLPQRLGGEPQPADGGPG